MDDDAPAPLEADPARSAEDRERRDQLWGAVKRLPTHEREVTELFYVHGYSLDEIARGLELPLTTVKKRLQYAREHIRENLPMMSLTTTSGGIGGVHLLQDVHIAALVALYRRYQIARDRAVGATCVSPIPWGRGLARFMNLALREFAMHIITSSRWSWSKPATANARLTSTRCCSKSA